MNGSDGLSGEVVGGNNDIVVVNIALTTAPSLTSPRLHSELAPKVMEFHQKGYITSDLGTMLDADYFLFNHEQSDDIAYTLFQVTARGTNTFTADRVRFEQWSEDTGNSLRSAVSWTNMNLNFNDYLVGVDATGKTNTSGTAGGVQLKKLTFGGFLTPRWTYPDQAPYGVLTNHILSTVKTVWFSVGVQGSGTNLVGYAKRMLTVSPAATPVIRLNVMYDSTNAAVRISYTNILSQTVILQRTREIRGTNTAWIDIASANQGNNFSEAVTDGPVGFFRLYLPGSN